MCPAPRRRPLPHRPTLLAAVLALLAGVSTASAACLRGGPDLAALSETDTRAAASGDLLELTNATLAARLGAAASSQRYILYTTTSAWQPDSINMTVNWFAHIQRCAAAMADRGLGGLSTKDAGGSRATSGRIAAAATTTRTVAQSERVCSKMVFAHGGA